MTTDGETDDRDGTGAADDTTAGVAGGDAGGDHAAAGPSPDAAGEVSGNGAHDPGTGPDDGGSTNDERAERDRSVTIMFTIQVHGTADQACATVDRIIHNLEIELHRKVKLDDWQMF